MAWHMESGDDSLLYKYFKQKYLKHCDFVDASYKSSASWVWKTVSSKQLRAKFSSVADLIIHFTHQWNISLVSQFFNQRDCKLILKIPLSVRGGVDCKVWGFSKDGLFSIKSTYHVAISILNPPSPPLAEGCSFDAMDSGLWKAVWHIRAFRKIQLFVWQCPHERILVNSQLFKRGAYKFWCCYICGSHDETIDHLLCTCPFACKVWKLCPLRMDFSCSQPTLWQKRWFDMCENWLLVDGFNQCIGLAAFICWSLWKNRNAVVFNNASSDPLAVVQKALTSFNEFQEVSRQNSLCSLPCPTLTSPLEVWKVLEEGYHKLNFNAAFNSISKSQGGGGD
ncbi:uncharacterized protein LOC132277385 [Cornus florida]|uniref:uncharacterized protein LOC132277385 n=1 Tax=Cornus florida TaxID=4283 RepID=UPI00289B5522|nr:uncharacterized protein LOC132277385 [Cornus florida]